MLSKSQVSKQLAQLARQVCDVVVNNSAGEMSRRGNWAFFVKVIPADHRLKELADECFDALSEEQKRQFRARIDRSSRGR